MAIYKSSIVIERIDYLLMEKGAGESVFPQSEFINMVSEALCTPIEQIWRVKINDDGVVDMYSFAMPQEKNLPAARCLNTAALPDWIKERIAVLQICDKGDIIDGVRKKLSDKVFYVIE
jgi:hypothetical protein